MSMQAVSDAIPAPTLIKVQPRAIDRPRNVTLTACVRTKRLEIVSNLGQALGKIKLLCEGVLLNTTVCLRQPCASHSIHRLSDA
jgi:hypothetical protein